MIIILIILNIGKKNRKKICLKAKEIYKKLFKENIGLYVNDEKIKFDLNIKLMIQKKLKLNLNLKKN